MLPSTINKLPIGTFTKVVKLFQGSIRKAKSTVLLHPISKFLWMLLLWVMLIISARDVFSKTKHYLNDLSTIEKGVCMIKEQRRTNVTLELNNNEDAETKVLEGSLEKMQLNTERAI